MISVIPFFIVAFMATLTIAIGQAMTHQPDQMTPKPLNAIIVGGLGWSALVMALINSIVHLGLMIPAVSGATLYGAYRIMSGTDYSRIYPIALPFGLVTLVATIFVAAQHYTVRSIS